MKISVQKRISIAFITLVVLGGVIWLISDYRNQMLTLKFEIITEKNRLLNTILEARRYEKNYFLYYNEKDLMEAIAYTRTAEAQMAQIIDRYLDYAYSGDLTAYQRDLKRYKQALVSLKNHDRNNPVGGNPGQPKLNDTSLLKTIRTLGRNITNELEKMVRLERESVNQLVKSSRLYIMIGTLVVFLLSLFVAFSLIFNINRPLRKIRRAVSKIADGDYEKIPPLKSGDEFDEFVQSLNTMISEVNKRNKQLVQSRKMASLGTLTSGVAHELNNPLNNISTSLQIALEELESGDIAYNKELLTDAESQIERARDIVRALLEFSRERSFKPKPSAVRTLVEESIKLIKGELPSSVDLQINVADEVRTVIDFRRMQQVMINLVLNAVHAMDGRGRLTIRAENDYERREVCIAISDTGEGIAADKIDKIFDPFYTTKQVGKGTGLGLSVSHGIIENHGGRIQVESREGEGTTFYIFLPMPENEDENGS